MAIDKVYENLSVFLILLIISAPVPKFNDKPNQSNNKGMRHCLVKSCGYMRLPPVLKNKASSCMPKTVVLEWPLAARSKNQLNQNKDFSQPGTKTF